MQTPQFVRDTDLAERYSVSRATIWRWVREGRFPAPVTISPGTTRWSLEAIEAHEREFAPREATA